MNADNSRSALLVLAGFAAGIGIAALPAAFASPDGGQVDLSSKRFLVSIDEIKQNFVFGEEFVGSYARTITLSDGSTRTIKLTPMLLDGKQVVELKDKGGHTYMSLNGTTTNGTLMVQLVDLDQMDADLKQQGW